MRNAMLWTFLLLLCCTKQPEKVMVANSAEAIEVDYLKVVVRETERVNDFETVGVTNSRS